MGAGFGGLHDGVDLAVNSTDECERDLALGGEGLGGEVEGAVDGAGDVDAGHRQRKASGQLLGDVGPAADYVEERRLALAHGAQDGVLRFVARQGRCRHGWFLSL